MSTVLSSLLRSQQRPQNDLFCVEYMGQSFNLSSSRFPFLVRTHRRTDRHTHSHRCNWDHSPMAMASRKFVLSASQKIMGGKWWNKVVYKSISTKMTYFVSGGTSNLKTWFYAQLLHAARCNNCTRNHGITSVNQLPCLWQTHALFATNLAPPCDHVSV